MKGIKRNKNNEPREKPERKQTESQPKKMKENGIDKKPTKNQKTQKNPTNQSSINQSPHNSKESKKELSGRFFTLKKMLVIVTTANLLIHDTRSSPTITNLKVHTTGSVDDICASYKSYTGQSVVFYTWLKLSTKVNAGNPSPFNEYISELDYVSASNPACEVFIPSQWLLLVLTYGIEDPVTCKTKFGFNSITCCLEYQSSLTSASAHSTGCSTTYSDLADIFAVNINSEIYDGISVPNIKTNNLATHYDKIYSFAIDPADFTDELSFAVAAGEPLFVKNTHFTKFQEQEFSDIISSDPAELKEMYDSINGFGISLQKYQPKIQNFPFFRSDMKGCATITSTFVIYSKINEPVPISGGFVILDLDLTVNSKLIELRLMLSRHNQILCRIYFLQRGSGTAINPGAITTANGWTKDDFITVWLTLHICPYLAKDSVLITGIIDAQHSKDTSISNSDPAYLTYSITSPTFASPVVFDRDISLKYFTEVNSGSEDNLDIYLKEMTQISGGMTPYAVRGTNTATNPISYSGRLVLGLSDSTKIAAACQNFYYMDDLLSFGKACINVGNGQNGCIEMRSRSYCNRCQSGYYEDREQGGGSGACRSDSESCLQPLFLKYSSNVCSSCQISPDGCFCNNYQTKDTTSGECLCNVPNCKPFNFVNNSLLDLLDFFSFFFRFFHVF